MIFEQFFNFSLNSSGLETLLNHLSHLINANLIEKVDFGIYSITGDGIEFIEAIERVYHQSPSKEKKDLKPYKQERFLIHFLIDIANESN